MHLKADCFWPAVCSSHSLGNGHFRPLHSTSCSGYNSGFASILGRQPLIKYFVVYTCKPMEMYSFIHSHFHPLAWSSLDYNLSIASTELEPPVGYFYPLVTIHVHWKFTHWLLQIGFIGLESSPLDQRLYYFVNRFVLGSIFIGLSELLFIIRNIGETHCIQRNINTHL